MLGTDRETQINTDMRQTKSNDNASAATTAQCEIPLGTKRFSVVTWQGSRGEGKWNFIVVAYRRDRFKRSGRTGWRKLGFASVTNKSAKFETRKLALGAGRIEVEAMEYSDSEIRRQRQAMLDRSSPHHWLPVGQAVRVEAEKLYRPSSFTESGERYFHFQGTIAEHLVGGGVSVKFDNYPNIVDYTRKEAARFITIH